MGHAPENTLLAFKTGLALGADAVELDVQLSADGGVVVIHDATVDRTTNGTGLVQDLTLAQLKTLEAGQGEAIPTLEEVLVWARGQVPVVIELKFGPQVAQLAQACMNVVDRLDMGSEVVFISFDHCTLQGLKQHRPWQTGLLYVARVLDPVGLARAAGADGVMPLWTYLTPEMVQSVQAAGLWVGTWTPNTLQELETVLSLGVNLIGTNYPDRLVGLLREQASKALISTPLSTQA